MAILKKSGARKNLAVGRIWLTRSILNGAGTVAIKDNETDANFVLNLSPEEVLEIALWFANQEQPQ